jgi:sucrose-6F-phosphate phosphohydrolase
MNWLLVSDVDDTLTGDAMALKQLAESLFDEPRNVVIAFNSSRPCASVRASLDRDLGLPVPDFLIGALGTEIEDGHTGQRLDAYTSHLATHWQREAIDRLAQSLGFKPHADEFQTPLKASYDVGGASDYRRFLEQMQALGLSAKVVFSNRIKLDIVPETAGKGSAVRFLANWLGVSLDQVVVAGDSGNDIDMFMEPFRGIVVGNADDDLRALEGDHIYLATRDHAAGVLQGLQYWGILPQQGG